MENDTFPAGLLATYYSSRHQTGLYRNCAVTSHYTFTLVPPDPDSNHTPHPPLQEFTPLLSRALNQTIKAHPSLCYGILPASTVTSDTVLFKRLHSISWEDIVSISLSDTCPDAKAEEALICKDLGITHERTFEDQENTPAWRVRVLMHSVHEQEGRCSVCIQFIAHHGIADGLSCAAFQRTLHQELISATAGTPEKVNDVQWPYMVPETVGRPIAIEGAMEIFPQGYESVKSQGVPEKTPKKIWAGNFPHMPTIESYKSLVLLISIPPPQVQSLLKKCRSLKITVTGYLHGLIISYLARTTVTDDQLGLVGCTPYSLRKFSKLPLSEIANHISYITTDWGAELLNRIRRTREESPEEEELIAMIGKQLTDEISAQLQRIETEGVSQLRTVKQIGDLNSYCRKALSVGRTESYEISNLGVVRMNEVPQEESLKLEGLIFSQSGMVHGGPIGCNVANLEGGPLVISLTWQQGGVEDEVMIGLQDFLRNRLGA